MACNPLPLPAEPPWTPAAAPRLCWRGWWCKFRATNAIRGGGVTFNPLTSLPLFLSMSISRAWNLLRVSSGGLWWGLFPWVAGGARHGWCQGREWRHGQARGNPPGQLWYGETFRDWEKHFQHPFMILPNQNHRILDLWRRHCASTNAKWHPFILHGLHVCMAWLEELSLWRCTVATVDLDAFSLFCLPVFGETAGNTASGQFTSALKLSTIPVRESHFLVFLFFASAGLSNLHRITWSARIAWSSRTARGTGM